MSGEAPAASEFQGTEDEQILHKLGYAQELFRAMGGFQNFAISFTIISILAGCLTSYYIAFESGGPIAVTWGWLLVGLFSIIISLAMAEIASSFPTAGGLYYWASKLGSPGWGWATGWFNLIGQIAVTAAIGYGLSTFATVLFDDLFSFEKHTNSWFGFDYNETVFALYAVFMLAACIINVFDVRITSLLNTVSAYWHMVGVAIIVRRADRRSFAPSVSVVRVHRQGECDGLRRERDRLPARGVLARLRARAARCPSTRSPATTPLRTWRRRRTRPRGWPRSGCTCPWSSR